MGFFNPIFAAIKKGNILCVHGWGRGRSARYTGHVDNVKCRTGHTMLSFCIRHTLKHTYVRIYMIS